MHAVKPLNIDLNVTFKISEPESNRKEAQTAVAHVGVLLIFKYCGFPESFHSWLSSYRYVLES